MVDVTLKWPLIHGYFVHTPTKISLATLYGKIMDPEIKENLKCGMYFKHKMHKPNIYAVW